MPAVIAALAAWLSGWGRTSDEQRSDQDAASGADRGGLFAALGWVAAIVAVLVVARWNEDAESILDKLGGTEAWQLAWVPMLGLAIVLSLRRPAWKGFDEARWVIAAMIAAGGGALILPTGDGWSDLYSLHRMWLALVVAATLANAWAIESLARSGAAAWSLLVMCGAFGAAMLLAALNYAAPAEWCLAAISATLGVLVVGWLRIWRGRSFGGLWMVAYAGCFLAASMVTTARFYTYEDYPLWVYALALFLPVLVTAADLPLRRQSWRVRVPVAAVVTGVALAACVWKLVLSVPTETW